MERYIPLFVVKVENAMEWNGMEWNGTPFCRPMNGRGCYGCGIWVLSYVFNCLQCNYAKPGSAGLGYVIR